MINGSVDVILVMNTDHILQQTILTMNMKSFKNSLIMFINSMATITNLIASFLP